MKSAEIKDLSVKELQERIEAQKAQLTAEGTTCRIARRGPPRSSRNPAETSLVC